MNGDKLNAIALTRAGAATAARLGEAFEECAGWVPARFAADTPMATGFDEPVAALIARLWPRTRGFFLVMAAGIAVRSIAGLLEDKTVDPAVVVLDPMGRFAVPLLSGHLGGANDLARQIAQKLGSTPVITTATDAAGRPAAEVWASGRGWPWAPREGVVRVNGAWADGEPVAVYADPAGGGAPLVDELRADLAEVFEDVGEASRWRGALMAVTPRLVPELEADLWVRPRCLYLGVGCRRDAAPAQVIDGVRNALRAAGWAEGAVVEVASVDAKADEPALHALAETLGAPFRTSPPDVLAAVDVPTPSARVARAVGTPSVAEASALVASSGILVLPKVKGPTWTLAIALAKPSPAPVPHSPFTIAH